MKRFFFTITLEFLGRRIEVNDAIIHVQKTKEGIFFMTYVYNRLLARQKS